MTEVWKDIAGCNGLYQVSNYGRVKSFKRKGKVLSPVANKKGYLRVTICRNGKVSNLCVHRLVAEAFIPNKENKPQVNHLDGDKNNCCVENLAWCTGSENEKHAFENGLNSNKAAVEARKRKVLRHDGVVFDSVKAAADAIGCSHSLVSLACSNKRRTANGFAFEYLAEGVM